MAARHKSALKRHRQSLKRRDRNRHFRTLMRTAVKNVRTAITDGKAEEAQQALSKAVPTLDKLVTKGVIHRNEASRRVSRLTRQVNALREKV